MTYDKEKGFWQNIKWKLFMLKLDLTMASWDRKKQHLRRKYCRYGIHKLKMGHVSRISSRRTRSVHYIYCAFCEYKFFATKRDKLWYERNNHFG